MNNENKHKHKLNPALTIVVVFCLLSEGLVVFLANNSSNQIISSFSKEQEVLVNEVARQADTALTVDNSDKSNTENEIVNNIIKNEETSGSRYWLFGTEDTLIYIRDNSTTSNCAGKSLLDLMEEYKSEGGKNISLAEDMLQTKTSGSVAFSQRDSSKTYILSLNFFEVGEKTYLVGMVTSKEYILSTAQVYRNSTYLYVVTLLPCIIIIVLMIYFPLIITRKNNEIKKVTDELRSRNKLIEKNNTNETLELGIDTTAEMFDELTQTYTKAFFDAVFDNMIYREISFVIIHVHIKTDIIDVNNDVIKKVADILKDSVSQDSIIARIDYSEYAILLINIYLETARVLASKIDSNINEALGDLCVSISVDDQNNVNIEQREINYV